MTHVLDELAWRGLISQSTDLDKIRAAMTAGPITYYAGFDPTAPSLHIGNLVQLILLKHLQNAGHHPICLVGGSTGLIGDPKPSAERTLNSPDVVADWVAKISTQVAPFLSTSGKNPAVIVNNLDWTAPISAIDFLRDYGKHFRVNQMIKKDAVAARLESEQGISFTEFAYQMLQGLDYLHLYQKHNCTLQTGGQDQWGNLMAGVDLVHRAAGTSVHALTTPLVTTADGTKFGKSEGNAVWLNPELTSPYAFYQFWINVEDASVISYLKLFTFLSAEAIAELATQHADRPGARAAHRALAEEVTTLVHGEKACADVQSASKALFGQGDLVDLDPATLADALAPLPHASYAAGTEVSIIDLLVDTGLSQGRKAARRTIGEGGAYVNNEKITDENTIITAEHWLHGEHLVVRRGKKTLAAAHVKH